MSTPARSTAIFIGAVFAMGAMLFSDPGALAQTTSGSRARDARTSDGTPKVEVFLGASAIVAVPQDAPGNRFVWLAGGTGAVAFNFNRYLGVVGDFAGYRDTQLGETGTGAPPGSPFDSSGNAFTYMGGPQLSFRKYERITPFAHALFGATHASAVTRSGCTGVLCTPLPSENAFAMALGGGLDVGISRHFAIRAIQAEYLMTRFANLNPGTPTTGDRETQNDIRLASGIVFRFGGSPERPPLSYACSVSAPSVYPGDPLTVTGTPTGLRSKGTPVYSWTSDAGTVSGSTETGTVDTSNAKPGSYTIRGHVVDGKKADQMADCSADYKVMAFEPPTVSCSANPTSVNAGDSSTISAEGVSPQHRPLTYSYSASSGTINGSSSTATLNTTAGQSGDVTVTCNVTDDKGQSASATTTVSVQAPAPPPPPPLPSTQKLCSVNFERDSKRPTRVDNEAKACLDEVAMALQHAPDAKLAVVGNSMGGGNDSAAQRAVNVKAYLVQDKGIDASRIATYSGSAGTDSVDNTLIPSGANFDASSMSPVDASLAPIPRSQHASKRHRK